MKVASGIYDWLPLGLKVMRKIEEIVRQEMNAIGGQEVLLPVVQPKELWEASGRWGKYGKELLRLKDRKDAEFCLAATAEEVITTMVTKHVRSWKALPIMLYQIGTKFRDEIRPRFGILRGREFIMKDAYSFHATDEDAERYYETAKGAYCKIFDRLGLKYRPVEADSGPIGGSFSHEFMVLANTGEDIVVYCTKCEYAANRERAECRDEQALRHKGTKAQGEAAAPQDVHTPGLYSVEDVANLLKLPKDQFVKTLFYWANGDRPVVCLLRGDHELNEAKLKRVLKIDDLKKMEEAQYVKLCGAPVGFAGPQGLSEKVKKTNPKAVVVGDHAIKGVADGCSGSFKKDYHTVHLAYGRDFKADSYEDLRFAGEGDACPRCADGKLAFQKGIEVGHVFELGIKYSVPLNAVFLDAQGKSHPMVMGCYGIGTSRLVAAAVEQNSDANGIIWPRSIAPYDAAILCLDIDDPKVKETAVKIYEEAKKAGLDVLLDDREVQAGVKFKDADLIGIPLSIRIGKRGIAKGEVELKLRNSKTPKFVPVARTLEAVPEELKSYSVQ